MWNISLDEYRLTLDLPSCLDVAIGRDYSALRMLKIKALERGSEGPSLVAGTSRRNTQDKLRKHISGSSAPGVIQTCEAVDAL